MTKKIPTVDLYMTAYIVTGLTIYAMAGTERSSVLKIRPQMQIPEGPYMLFTYTKFLWDQPKLAISIGLFTPYPHIKWPPRIRLTVCARN